MKFFFLENCFDFFSQNSVIHTILILFWTIWKVLTFNCWSYFSNIMSIDWRNNFWETVFKQHLLYIKHFKIIARIFFNIGLQYFYLIFRKYYWSKWNFNHYGSIYDFFVANNFKNVLKYCRWNIVLYFNY